MSEEQKINRVIAGLSHYGYTTDLERGEAKLLIKDLQQERDYYKNIVEELKKFIQKDVDVYFCSKSAEKTFRSTEIVYRSIILNKLEELEKGDN